MFINDALENIKNKKAYYNYEILEKFQAGLVLNGQEVKSLRTRGISLSGTYIEIKKGEAFWVNAVIPPYQPLNTDKNYNPRRERKLLLNKKEINYLAQKAKERGLTLVPLSVYTGTYKIKLEFGLARGKKKFDKRESIKKREVERKIKSEIKHEGVNSL
jgi:SsrA-binding protein